MGWDGPILTDSGGFQVFSLRDTIAAVDDDGVTFRSVYDGAPARFTPELVASIQAQLGSDIAMCLDVCPPGVSRAELAEAVRRTTAWATRQRDAPRAPGQLVFGIAQGATDRGAARALDRRDHRARTSTATRSAASRVGEPRPEMLDAVAWAAPLLPADRPRYFMGIGDPEGILEVIARGDRHVRLRPADPARRAPAPRSPRTAASTSATRASPATQRPLDERCDVPGLRALLAARTSATSSTSRSCSGCGCSPCTTSASCST